MSGSTSNKSKQGNHLMALRYLIMALLLCTPSLHAQSVPLANLAMHPEYDNVKISPDGAYLAATAVVKGRTVLALIHLADKKGVNIRPLEDNNVIDFWWASPNRVVYTVGVPRGGYDQPLPTGELFAVDADGSHGILLFGQRLYNSHQARKNNPTLVELGAATFIAAIPPDPDHILVAINAFNADGNTKGTWPIAYRMDVHSGFLKGILAAPGPDMQFIADYQGRIRLIYGQDDHGHFKVYMRNSFSLVPEFGAAPSEPAARGKTYISPSDRNAWEPMSKAGMTGAKPLRFDRAGRVAYFSCGRQLTGFGICSLDTGTNAWRTVWTHPKVEPGDLLLGTTDDVIGVSFTDGRPGASLFDNQSADAQTLITLMKQFPGESVRFVSGTSDGHLSIVLVEADTDPGTFYLYDRNANKLTPLLARKPWIRPEQMASKQPFEFSARDGMKLQGYVSYPPGHENTQHLPMIVMVHGGPYGVRDLWNFDPEVQALATRGYAVLQVNFRGSGGYGYDFERAGFGEWGGKMQDDVTDATHWAITQGLADPQRICIFGASYGGYAALEGAVKEPELYKCAIGYLGVYDLAMMFTRGDIPQSAFGKNYLQLVLGNDMSVLAQRSPIDQLDRLKAKVMLVVGGKDKRAPPIQGINLHNALRKRHIEHEWLYKPDEMHGFYDEANVTELYTTMLQFIGSSIGPGVTTGTTGTGSAAAAH
jgi:dipeptidyl aminopeptidase/acylaminoacyl peptidase